MNEYYEKIEAVASKIAAQVVSHLQLVSDFLFSLHLYDS